MEAVLDHQLFAWHSVVGYAGTLNDINVWDSSLLHKPLIDGSFCRNDFEYSIGEEQFNMLWFLVDGIYPLLSCFVGSMSVQFWFWKHYICHGAGIQSKRHGAILWRVKEEVPYN